MEFRDKTYIWNGLNDTYSFFGYDEETKVECAISLEAVQDYFGGDIEAHMGEIQNVASTKYEKFGIDSEERVLLTTKDF